MRVVIHPNAMKDRDWEESERVLKFLGYKVQIMGQPFQPEADYIIDARIPEWRGVKNSVEHLKLNHPHSKIQEYNRWKDSLKDGLSPFGETGVDTFSVKCYTETDSEIDGCFT